MINEQRLREHLLSILRIDSPRYGERALADKLAGDLRALGLDPHIDATGNLITARPGTGEPVLLNAHMDNVEPCRGVNPVVRDDGVVCSDGATVLGADDKAGISAIIEALRVITELNLPAPPLDIAITMGEEDGLIGVSGLDCAQLSARQGICLDGGGAPGGITVKAPAKDSIDVTIHGTPSHAGGAPEKGISAICAASNAIARMKLGRIDAETTANIGHIEGGCGRNVVPERVEIMAEARSRDNKKLDRQTAHMVECFERACQECGARADIRVERLYTGYTLPTDTPVVRRLAAAARRIGLAPEYKEVGGGCDANIFNVRGLTVACVSIGGANAHSKEETLVLRDLYDTTRWLLETLVPGAGQ